MGAENLAEHLVRAGQECGARPAVAVGEGVCFDYRTLAGRVERLAGGLRTRLGLEPGDRVALILGNGPHYLELLYACWHAGLVAVPVNAKLHADEFAYIVDDSTARACFVSRALSSSLGPTQGVATLAHVCEVGSLDYRRLLEAEPGRLAPGSAPDDAAWLFYTSGTTGRPKGAVLSHRNLLTMCACYFADVDPVGPWDCIAHAAPLSHGSGLYGLAHVMRASCHVIPESGGFDAHELHCLIAAWPNLTFFAAPTMIKRLLAHPADTDTANLKLIAYGGGPMYVQDCIEALDRLGPKLSQLYGQGESPMTITACNAAVHADRDHPRWLERIGSVGVAQSAVDVKIADVDDAPLAPGEVGEVLVRGDSVMTGYWQNPAASAETLRGGWLHTGDIGTFDEDGFLTLMDRSKDLIISAGANIYPREVEEVLLRHPAVAEVSVIGRPDPEWGEAVVAYVVGADGAEPAAAELDRFCLEHLARFKRPRDYRTIDALPKNNYGKVLKTRLRELDRGQRGEQA